MAYSETFGDDPGAFARSSSAALGWLGAFSSLALVAGLSFWVWDLATRDAREVPVVRAMEGPARAAPEEPGGFEAEHQGYAVNSIASEAPETPLAERVVLAPRPVGPRPDDRVAATAEPAEAASPDDLLRSAVDDALGEVLGRNGATLRPAPSLSRDIRQPGTPPRPTPRPDLDVVTRAMPADGRARLTPASFQPPAMPEMDATAIVAGTRLVQLGAFGSRDEALDRWTLLGTEFSDYMSGKARVVETVELDGRSFYRLRAHGFDGLAEARNFCAVLIAEKADCIPVLTR